MINRILVPTDGSERAERAADYAIKLAQLNQAEVIFLSVVDELTPAYAFEAEGGFNPTALELSDQLREMAQSYVDKLKKLADQAGVKSTTKVTNGHPWEEILAESDRSGADHIVMSSHGRRALAAAVIGSVTINVIHGAKVPIIIVPTKK